MEKYHTAKGIPEPKGCGGNYRDSPRNGAWGRRMKAKGISGWQSKSRVSWDQYGRRQNSHIIEDLVG